MLDALAIGGGVDDGESPGLAARTLEITAAHTLEELLAFLFKRSLVPVSASRATARARPISIGASSSSVEVRTQFRLHVPFEVGDLLAADAAAVTLVRVSRVREAIAHGHAPRSSAGRIRFSMCVARAANISSSSHVIGIGSSVG